jgi:hypothetical protein
MQIEQSTTEEMSTIIGGTVFTFAIPIQFASRAWTSTVSEPTTGGSVLGDLPLESDYLYALPAVSVSPPTVEPPTNPLEDE